MHTAVHLISPIHCLQFDCFGPKSVYNGNTHTGGARRSLSTTASIATVVMTEILLEPTEMLIAVATVTEPGTVFL